MAWYKKSLNYIKEKDIQDITNILNNINYINDAYIWGDYIENKNYKSKQINIFLKTSFITDDLCSIIEGVNSPFLIQEEKLEDEGFNKEAVIFTKKIIKISKINPIISSKNNKILHWGHILEDKNELDQIKEEAEKYASFITDTEKNKLFKSSKKIQEKWSVMYNHYINKYLRDIPKGWYIFDCNIDNIIKNSKKIKG